MFVMVPDPVLKYKTMQKIVKHMCTLKLSIGF